MACSLEPQTSNSPSTSPSSPSSTSSTSIPAACLDIMGGEQSGVRERDKKGMVPLHILSKNYKLEMNPTMFFLLKEMLREEDLGGGGWLVDEQCDEGNTALHYAAEVFFFLI